VDAKPSENTWDQGFESFPDSRFLSRIKYLKWYSEGRVRRHGQALYLNRSFLYANKRKYSQHMAWRALGCERWRIHRERFYRARHARGVRARTFVKAANLHGRHDNMTPT
jgi:hypothetical protein